MSTQNPWPEGMNTPAEKAAHCRKVLAGYPDKDSAEAVKVRKQAENYEGMRNMSQQRNNYWLGAECQVQQ
jgi:hypothetical protein